MKTYNNSVTLRNDGFDTSTSEKDLNAAVGLNITVRVASTPTAGLGALASVFDVAEVAIANPMQTDNQGNYTFKAADGLYDIVIAEGTADETILASEEIVELITPDFISNLSLPYVFDTVADMTASTIAFPVGKILNVKGYHSVSVGGGVWEVINKGVTPDLDLPDGTNILQLSENPSLAVKNIDGDYKYIKQLGAYGDGVNNDSYHLDNALYGINLTSGSYLYDSAVTRDIEDFGDVDGDFFGYTNPQSTTFRDVNGVFRGIHQNYNEEKRNLSGVTPKITTGQISSPPVSTANPVESVSIMAHWYNDFGLDYTRVQNGTGGWVGWYTWEWNHTDTTIDGDYDPDRHPLLGWFRGDDVNVIDWHCYWLREAGLTGVLLQATGLDTTLWGDPEDRDYWLYQLFKNTPNFKGLNYCIGGPAQGDKAELISAWEGIINDIYLVHGNYQIVNVNGGRYPAIYLHDVATMRSGVFSSDTEFESWMGGISDTFKSAGFDGVFIYGRNATFYTLEANKALYNRLSLLDIVMVEIDYGNFSGSYTAPTVYSDYINEFGTAYDAVKFRHLPNVMTARDSKSHPSGWDTPGSTPALFRDGLEKAANAAIKNDTIPNIVTIYNIGEWAEAGASLQPSVGQGWGYMNALRQINAEEGLTKNTVLDMSYTKRIDGATENIKPSRPFVDIYTTFSVTLNSAPYLPTIKAGYDKQRITLINTGDAGSFNVIFSDNGTTAGTRLKLSASSVTVGVGSSISLTYSESLDLWIEG